MKGLFKDFNISKFKNKKPPGNKSLGTYKEIKELSNIKSDRKFVEDKDDVFATFKSVAEKNNIDYPSKLVKTLINESGKPITNWNGATIMNTKIVEPIYEAAHCLYASRMDIIGHGHWMDVTSPPEPELFTMEELEAFDIDYEWQFKLGETLYGNRNEIL